MTIGSVIALAALPLVGGLLLWLTSWMESHVADEITGPDVVEPEPDEPPSVRPAA
jgi:hypothetical protein